MSEKVTVTRYQHDMLCGMDKFYVSLGHLLETKKELLDGRLRTMTDEQIAAIWLGVADIEPEPVEPWEALKAIYQGKTVKKVDYDGGITILNDYVELDNFSVFHPDAVESLGTKFYILEDE